MYDVTSQKTITFILNYDFESAYKFLKNFGAVIIYKGKAVP